MPIIIFAIGLSKFENKKFSFFIIFFVIVELIANLISYHDALQSANIILYHHTIPLVQVIPKIFFIGCCILILGVLLGVWIKREALKLIHIKTITYQRKIIFLIEIYLLLIITITLWIHVNYPLIEK